MIKTQYSGDFEIFWDVFTGEFGAKGSKKNAYKVFKSLKLNELDIITLIIAAKKQHHEKRIAVEWCESFQHVENWLKNQRWEDDPNEQSNRVSKRPTSRRDATRAAIGRPSDGACIDVEPEQIGQLRLVKRPRGNG